MDEIIQSHSIRWIAASKAAAAASKVNDSNSLDLRSFLITYNIANLVLIRFGLARLCKVHLCSVRNSAERKMLAWTKTSHTTVHGRFHPTNQPVNSTLNANLVSVLMEIISSFFAFFFIFNFHIFQQWQRNWLAFCNHTPDKKNHFFMIL